MYIYIYLTQGIAAGVASELYVQTRDQFGNAIRTDDQFYPLAQVSALVYLVHKSMSMYLCQCPSILTI